MRFDGYFVLSDALDFPNLHERGSACARWWLRTTFFRLPEAQPEPMLSVRNRRWLIAFACTTWIYRLVVFLGIALLVYYMFFKLLGIALMVVELWWFIFRPVAAECAEIWRVRDRARPAAGPFIGLFALLGAIIWLVPISSQVGAPGILRAAREQAVYAPFPARLIALEVESGQLVEAGALLARLEAPDIKLRAEQAGVAIVSAQAELARTPASQSQQERRAVLQQELAEALATKQAVQAAIGQQELRAFHAGTVRDLPNDLAVGRWLNPNQLLMHVVSQGDALIEAFVDERQVRAVSAGQSIRFYPSRADLPPLTGTVLAVDKSPIKELSRPVLASVYGGNIAVTQSQNGALLAQDAAYRVTVAPAGVVPQVDEVLGGTVRIETNWHFITENFLYRMLSVLIRESGF